MTNALSKHKWTIFAWINVLWLLGTLALGYISYTSVPPTGSSRAIETTKVIFLALGGLVLVLPTYLNVFGAVEGRHFQILENTFSLIQRWDDPPLLAARKFTRDLKARKAQLSDADLIAEIKTKEELKQSVILVLNYFDQVRVSLKSKRVDSTLIRDSMGGIFDDMYRRLLPYVESEGQTSKKDWEALHEMLK